MKTGLKLALIALSGAVTYVVMMRRHRKQYPETRSMGHVIDYLTPQSRWVNAQDNIMTVDMVDHMFVHYHDNGEFQHRMNVGTFVSSHTPLHR